MSPRNKRATNETTKKQKDDYQLLLTRLPLALRAELEQLATDRDDDNVSVAEWTQRARKVAAKGNRLPGAMRDIFNRAIASYANEERAAEHSVDPSAATQPTPLDRIPE